MMFMDRFADLSPLGAFSGYAQGLLYFGLAFPVFYFVLGSIAAWLFRRAKDSSFWSGSPLRLFCVRFSVSSHARRLHHPRQNVY